MQLHVDHGSDSHLHVNLAIKLAGAVMGHFGLSTLCNPLCTSMSRAGSPGDHMVLLQQ